MTGDGLGLETTDAWRKLRDGDGSGTGYDGRWLSNFLRQVETEDCLGLEAADD